MCLFVPKDLANRWTDMILLYRVASQVLGRFITILGEGTTILPRENSPKKKSPIQKQILKTLEALK